MSPTNTPGGAIPLVVFALNGEPALVLFGVSVGQTITTFAHYVLLPIEQGAHLHETHLEGQFWSLVPGGLSVRTATPLTHNHKALRTGLLSGQGNPIELERA